MGEKQKASDSVPDLSAYGFLRSLNAKERDRQIAGVLKRIKELEQRTNPAGGEATAVGKDALASEALALAGWLVQLIAGWAFNHQYGLALKGLVESPGGISPPGAPRTVHDPLESHGSRCSAVAMT